MVGVCNLLKNRLIAVLRCPLVGEITLQLEEEEEEEEKKSDGTFD
jgi:hypothetical protein